MSKSSLVTGEPIWPTRGKAGIKCRNKPWLIAFTVAVLAFKVVDAIQFPLNAGPSNEQIGIAAIFITIMVVAPIVAIAVTWKWLSARERRAAQVDLRDVPHGKVCKECEQTIPVDSEFCRHCGAPSD